MKSFALCFEPHSKVKFLAFEEDSLRESEMTPFKVLQISKILSADFDASFRKLARVGFELVEFNLPDSLHIS